MCISICIYIYMYIHIVYMYVRTLLDPPFLYNLSVLGWMPGKPAWSDVATPGIIDAQIIILFRPIEIY